MTAALVVKPRRKRHLAGHGPDGAWWTVCDLIVSGSDVTAVPVELVDVDELEAHPDRLCAHCRRLILMAAVVDALGVSRLVASLRLAA